MKTIKLFFALISLIAGGGNLWADDVPFLLEKNSFGGTAVSQLSTFYSTATKYTLELTGCVADQEITVLGGSFSYTPTANGTVRFVRNGGDVVYVYEGTTYKGTVAVSALETPTYPDIFAATDDSSTGAGIYDAANLFQNPGFETKGDKISDHNYIGANWDCNGYSYSNKSRVRDNTSFSGQEGSCTFFIHGYGNPAECLSQTMTGLNNFTPYKFQVRSWKHETNNAKFGITIGTSAGDGSVYSGEITLPNDNSTKDQSLIFTTGAITGSSYVFALTRKTTNGMGDFDRMTLVAANGGGIGITGATGASFLSGSVYAPEGAFGASTDYSLASTYTTSLVTNGTFGSNANGWTTTTGASNKGVASNQAGAFTGNFWENWNGSNYTGKMYQSVSDVPNGTYKLNICAFVNNVDASKGQYVYANDNKSYVYTTTPTAYTVYTYVDNHTLEYGLYQTTEMNNWMGIDNVSLEYCGASDVATAGFKAIYDNLPDFLNDSEYENVVGTEKTNLQTAVTNNASPTATADGYATATFNINYYVGPFVAAKENYDLLAAEITKATALGTDASDYVATSLTTAATALTNTQDLKVAEYTYVTDNYPYGVALGEWTSTGTNTSAATFSNEHWSGTTHNYKNQKDGDGLGYNASSWSINFSQDVTLPAGNYVFKVAGRQASGDQVTTSLVVKNGEDVLGTISDFPRSNNSRGINTSGETDFTTGEGHTYANSGAGYGWEWRYVKFTLESDATVNIAINSFATDIHQWVSFGDYTLQTDDEKNISLITYNVALANAQTIIADETYSNVTGSENTDLSAAIAADTSLDKTDKDKIDAATTTLNDAIEAFTGAKSSYDTYVAAKAVEYEDNKPYADAAKFTAIGTAQAAAAATSASDAESKTAAIISAYRKYLESHALAEGVAAKEQITVQDFRFADVSDCSDKENWKVTENWFLDGQNNGSISFSTDNSLTDGDGNADYNYIRIQKSDNNAGIHQTINLEPGHYMMTVSARCQSGQGAKFEAFAGDVYVSIPQNDNTNGQFGSGWNDVNVEFDVTTTSDVNIGVKSDWGKNIWWTATRFRLVKLQESVTVTSAGYATYASDHALDFTNSDTKAYIAETKGDGTGVTFTPVDKVPAGTGVLLYKDGGATENIPVFNGTGADDVADNVFVRGTGAAVATDGGTTWNYILNNKGGNLGFYKAAGQNVATNRAYISILKSETPSPVKEFFSLPGFEDATAIENVNANVNDNNAVIYNVAGQRISKLQKGINIVNGKKILK